MKELYGNTFVHKEALRALGGRWVNEKKCWEVPDDKFVEANALLATTPPPVVKNRAISRQQAMNFVNGNFCAHCGNALRKATL